MEGRIITDSKGLISQPHHPFWDGHPTRREIQAITNVLSNNDEVLTMRADTGHIVINLICEKLGIQRKDLDEYVAKKLAQMRAEAAILKAQELAKEGNSGPNE